VTTYCGLFSLAGVQAFVFLITALCECFYLLSCLLNICCVYGIGIHPSSQASFGCDAGDVSERVGDANDITTS